MLEVNQVENLLAAREEGSVPFFTGGTVLAASAPGQPVHLRAASSTG
jgi:hypothetical protein